jgi:hypothetical protein
VKTIHVATELPTDADRVFRAVQHPSSFLYVCRGLFGIPALAGRTEPMVAGEAGTGWLWALHAIPLYRHTIEIVDVDPETRSVHTNEHGGVLRTWNHTLHVEPVSATSCRYSDTVVIDAGLLTRPMAVFAVALFRYRQRRWHRLVDKHLLPEGPAFLRAARI